MNGVERPAVDERHRSRQADSLGRIEDRWMAALRRAQGASTPVRASIVVAVMLAALAIDWVTGPDTSAMLEFAIASSVAAWLCGMKRAGALVATMLMASTVMQVRTDDEFPDWLTCVNGVIRTLTVLFVVFVVAAFRRHIDRAEFVAHVDPLTGCWSRGALLDNLEHAVHHAHRAGGALSVLFLDLDRLKDVNDTEGHAAGDAVIRRFARVVMTHVRRSDVFGRLAGDEFLVICPATDAASACRLKERIQRDPDLPSVSIGVAELSPGQTAGQLLVEADQAMYSAKRR